MHIDMFTDAKTIMETLLSQGFQAYIVGGAVRDYLLGSQINDIDLCTDATPEQVLEHFPQAIPTGIAYGTVTVIINGNPFEVTTFRTEGKYSDGRRPDYVQFIPSLQEDLSRRDFTINAMALDWNETLIDPFGGQADLRNRTIRAVGEPDLRFEEDGLRIIRGIRFMCQLNFQIEEKTERAMLKQSHHLTNIAIERVTTELKKIMKTELASLGWQTLHRLNILINVPVFAAVLPDAWLDCLQSVTVKLDDTKDSTVKWTLLMVEWNLTLSTATRLLKGLTFAKKESEPIIQLLTLYEQKRSLPLTENEKISLLLEYGITIALKYIEMMEILQERDPLTIAAAKNELLCFYEQLPINSLNQLAINGSRLIESFNKKPGPWVGDALHQLLHAVVKGLCDNESNALLTYAKKNIGGSNET